MRNKTRSARGVMSSWFLNMYTLLANFHTYAKLANWRDTRESKAAFIISLAGLCYQGASRAPGAPFPQMLSSTVQDKLYFHDKTVRSLVVEEREYNT